MNADARARLVTLVPDALDLPPEQRDAFLDTACRQPDGTMDTEMREAAAALVAAALAAIEADDLASPVAGLVGELATDEALGSHAPPETVGPWRVTGVLGEGGQGVVYRARRADGAFDREVALKLLRPGHRPGERLAARLAEERRVLAGLDHAGIARLYDGGVTDDGLPYLALELVDGQPVTAWAASIRPSVRQRVEVLAQICEAVAYAHARLVVHRDLKPTNVLVTAEGHPKLLDFGIAKLLDADAAPDDWTAAGWMTPAYAAPEQVRGEEITTATDVYALGVLAYEVLAGQRPYSTADKSPAEIERLVCDATPPPPSSANSTAGRALQGDLDTIVMKALAKEPERRYASAEALALDLRRHLEGLPVEARTPTVGYRLGRFARRHRAGVLGTAAALLAIIAVTGIAFSRVSAERDRAEAEAANAVAAQDFVYGMLAAPRSEEQGRDVRVADLLDEASAVLDSTLGGQPVVLVEARSRLANTYNSLGLYEESARENARCIEVATQAFGPNSDDALICQVNMGSAYRLLGNVARADSVISEALAALLRRYNPDAAELADAYNALAAVRFDQGDPEAGLELAQLVLAIDRRRAQVDPEALGDMALSLSEVGTQLYGLGRFDDAIRHAEEALAINEASGDTARLSFAVDLRNLGAMYVRAERLSEGERAMRRAIRIGEGAGGPDHPRVAGFYAMLGQFLTRNGDLNEAEALIRKSLQIREKALGPDHVEMAYSWEFLALVLHAKGQTAAMREAAREARRLYARHFGEDHQWVADVDTLLIAS